MSSQSFENKQQSYYMHELNRALPTRGNNPDLSTLQLALGNPDPAMPQGARQVSEVRDFVSDFGARTSAVQRDAECRAIPYPGSAMRAADARAGCGWWFSPNPSVPSIGAYGTRRGPMSPNLDTQIGPGQWVWDTQQAYMLEGMKAAAAVQACPDLQFSRNPKIGWCPSTGRAIMTDGNGNPAFPQMSGGDCPGGGIVMNAASCPPPPPPPGPGASAASGNAVPGGISALCQPTNGVLGPDCLQAISGMFCSPNGSLYQSLGNGYAGQTPSFNNTNQYLLQRGFTLNSGIVNDGKVSVDNAIASVVGVKAIANAGDGSRANEAAMNLCYGTPFNPCFFNPGDKGPYDANCITETALGMGYNANGKLLPAAIGMAYWNQFGTWQNVLDNLAWWKTVADLGPLFSGQGIKPSDQANGIMNVYGTSVKYPKQGCNNFGVLLYRYYFPTWDGTLFPPQGAQTHFLGRYIFKNGFPAQGSTMQDMTPAGGYLTEGQRMVADFYPVLGGNYQFLIACDDFVRIQVNGQVIGQVGCCGVPTPTQIVPMIADQPYELIIDLWNGGGPWSFVIAMSIDGSAWQPIPLQQLYMTQDRRLPMIELAFNKMPANTSGAIEDTSNVLNNLQMVNTSIGQLGGKQCLLVNGPKSGVFNNMTFLQGIRIRSMKSITMMVMITTIAYPTGTAPSLFSFYNLPDSSPTTYPRKALGSQAYTYFQRTTDLMIAANASAIYPYSIIDPNIRDNIGISSPYTTGQWVHIALVWNEDFQGYTFYINGKALPSYTLPTPPYDIQVMAENITIGCDNHPEGQNWTGGIAWFRAFDYRLSQELITRDMNDGWASLN